jgi:hypothetical protein
LTEDVQGRRWLTGLVPDGNPVVRLELHDDQEQVVPTVQGVVVVKELECVRAIAFLDVAGSRSDKRIDAVRPAAIPEPAARQRLRGPIPEARVEGDG